MKQSKRTLAKTVVILLDKHPVHQAMEALAQEMVRQRSTRDIDSMVHAIGAELYSAKKHLIAEVISAHPLSSSAKKYIEHFLKKKCKAKTVNIFYRIDSEIIGGIKIITPIGVLNLSIAEQLEQLKQYVS
ncbi:MAG TPA: F0F1 ATP synthase subunit delta [Candidatus Andersenbacteria bacterium]|nr:F0F1 ATP synthase subunit delta [Candidatus Andersenbacteria bacterium]